MALDLFEDRPDVGGDMVDVDVGHQRQLDLAIELPDDELEAVAPREQLDEVLDRIAAHDGDPDFHNRAARSILSA